MAPFAGHRRLSRRNFVCLAGAFAASPMVPCSAGVFAQKVRSNVAAMEHDRILVEAKAALLRPVRTLTGAPAPSSFSTSANEFASNPAPDGPLRVGVARPFRAHADLLRQFRDAVAALTSASVLTAKESAEDAYAQRAAAHLRAWFVTPDTRMAPVPAYAGMVLTGSGETAKATQTSVFVMDLVPLAEIARAGSFLVDSGGLSPEEWDTINAWFAELLEWLNTERVALLARDAKDHRASAWLLLCAALARSQRNTTRLDQCRHRLRTPTLRNQLLADGTFPQELATPTPYRNTLMNFDLLATACELLASPFDPLWDYELQDGPGLRSMAAFVYPVVREPAKWPFVADANHFRELPGRRHGLLFAGRAYQHQDYIDLWQSLPADVPEDLAESFPIRQPLLFTTRAAHGL